MTQTVYTIVQDSDINIDALIRNDRLKKLENVYVFTPEQFEKAIGDAFDAGNEWTEFHLAQGFLGIKNPNPDKTEYLNNLK